MHSKNQRRHGSPSSSRAPLVPMKAKMSLSQSEVEPLPFRVPRDYPHSRFSKAPLAVYPPKGGRTKACVSLPVVTLEKMPCFSRSEGAHVKVNSSSSTSSSSSSSSSLSVPSSSPASSSTSASLNSTLPSPASHKNQEKLLNGRGPVTPRSTTPPLLIDRRPSPSRSPLDKRPAPSPSAQDRRPAASPSPSSADRRTGVPPSPSDRKHPNGAKGNRHRRVSGRVFDPNKHCGVLDPESKRPCTRSLTCKTHSLTHRRAVPGRKKDFDILLAEHKGRAKEKEAGQKRDTAGSQSAQSAQSLDTSSSNVPSSCHNGKTTPTLKLRLANAHINRGSGGGGAVVLSSTPVPVPAPDPVLPSWQKCGGDVRVSSDEGEAELPEDTEKPSCHYSPYHPRPISCCAFRSRLMGRGHYVFDRRWDRMRLALHCMVEKHVNAQMWRKVPLVADSVVSSSPSPSEASPLSSPSLSTLAPALPDGVSMVSYSTPFSHNGAGVFCIRDPEPSPKLPQTKAAKPARTSGEGVAVKRRKPPPISDTAAYRKNGNGYHPPPGPAHISNGTAALSVRAKPRTGGPGPRDSDRYPSVELSLPQALTGDHGGVSSHSPLPCSSAEARKRKTSSSGDRPGKITKTTALDGIFRKSSAGLLSSVAEASQSALSRLPKVHH
ncbi:ataxin-7-like protein 1 [Colossoma macropomum]|uniref:ataxin-7-like protein 1 n=1 Tax=Colossoma macropomum TaxID=42526 RepID=UPI0018641A46|nr:ataxin-7-like protein 1 [Colossoma macropomum]